MKRTTQKAVGARGVPKLHRQPFSRSSGFTLVELMVALTGGLFVTAAVFVLSKQATSLYQSEARLSNATLGAVVGFERLRVDIERAGFLSSPNVARDPKVCGTPDASWPKSTSGNGQYLQHLSSLYIEASTTAPALLTTTNKITPDEITLAGSYASADQFDTVAIQNDGVNNVVTLAAGSPPMARLGYPAAPDAATQRALLLSVFGIGRVLRIVDSSGKEQYGSIVNVQEGTSPSILVSGTAPAVLYRGASAALKCGVYGTGSQSLVNVVNFIRYSLKDMSTSTRYAALFATGPATDTGRTELIREELDARGAPITDSAGISLAEIVSEFAVDLAFSVVASQVVTNSAGAQAEQLAAVAGSDRSAWVGPTWGANPATAAIGNKGPQLVRTVRARLSVRSREADRQANVSTYGDGGTDPVMGGLYRFRVSGGAGASFARVRTMQADIAIRNSRSATWL
jgi:type II secretory pathway pseudopilin PulG